MPAEEHPGLSVWRTRTQRTAQLSTPGSLHFLPPGLLSVPGIGHSHTQPREGGFLRPKSAAPHHPTFRPSYSVIPRSLSQTPPPHLSFSNLPVMVRQCSRHSLKYVSFHLLVNCLTTPARNTPRGRHLFCLVYPSSSTETHPAPSRCLGNRVTRMLVFPRWGCDG